MPTSVTYTDFRAPAVNAAWLNDVDQCKQANVNVKMFGAKGDGVTDDAAAIQNAVNYILAQPTGGRLHFPAGTYNMSVQVAILMGTNQAVTLTGDGHATNLRHMGGIGGVTLFNIGQPVAIFGANLTMRDMGFSQSIGAPANAVTLTNVNTSLFDNVNFYNPINGIILNSSFYTRVQNCYFYGCSSAAIQDFMTGTNALIFRDNAVQACDVGVSLVNGGNNILVEGNDFEGNRISMGITNYTSVIFRGNYVELGTGPAFFFGGTNACVEIEQNWLGQNAISTNLGNISFGRFSMNTIYQSTWTTTAASNFIMGVNDLLAGASVATTPWAVPTLSNGFTTQTNYYAVQYLKNNDGVVYFRGNTINGGDNLIVFNIPPGYRPLANQTFATGSSTTPGASIVEIRANGDVFCLVRNSTGGCGWNFSYYAEG